MAESQLSIISRIIAETGARNEQARQEFSHALEQQECLLFQRYDDDLPEGHGIGWFQIGDRVFAFRRYSNGYQSSPSFSIKADELKQLARGVK